MPATNPAIDNVRASTIIAEGTNSLFKHSVTVKAPPERVWTIWMDVTNWPTWDPLIKESSSAGPLRLGVQGRVVPHRGLPSRFKIVSFEPKIKWALEASLIAAKLKVTRSLTTQDGLTTFTHEVEFSGFASSIFANLLGPEFRVALPEVMNRLAAQAMTSEEE
jgi:Polyketide cyclase / dehydrase and lipid transport